MAIATDTWIGAASADWGASAGNWSTGLPNSNDNIVVDTTAALTITFGGSDNFIVRSLVVGNDVFDMTGGSLTIAKGASFADAFTQSGGTLTAGGAVAIKGTGTLTGGSSKGDTRFAIDGTTAIGSYTLGGASVLANAGTVDETGQLTLGDATGIDAAIDNGKGAVFDIAGDFGIEEGAATAGFVNAAGATLEKTGGSNTSTIAVNVTDTGRIVVATGTIEFTGPDNSFAGTVSGAGQFELGTGGNDLIAAGARIESAAFTVTDANVTLDGSLGYAGAFTLENSAIFDLAGGAVTLTLSGTGTLGDATLDGSGTLVTPHGASADVDLFTLGGSVNWQNWGTVGEVATLALGDKTFNAATFTNEKGGIYEFTTDSGIASGAALDSKFVDFAGAALEKIGGTGISTVSADMVDEAGGAIVIRTGTIEFEGTFNSFAGTVSGRGQFALGSTGLGSEDVIAAGATIASASFGIYGNGAGPFVTLGENLHYAGTFLIENAAVLDPDGFMLTLSGADTLSGNATIDGTGTLITAKGGTASVDSFTLGGAVQWQNFGTIDETATLTLGDGSFSATLFTNEKGGVYEFLNDSSIVPASGVAPANSTARFVNAAGGTVAMTGTGTSLVEVHFTNDGRVLVGSGTLQFTDAVSGNGSYTIAPGAELQFDGAVAGGASVDFAGPRGGELYLADALEFRAAIKGFGGVGTDEFELADVAFANASFKLSYAGNNKEGVLTVTSDGETVRLTMFGDYKTADFLASAGPSGGTLIVGQETHPPLFAAR